MMLESHMKLCVTEPDFPEKNFLPPKIGKMDKNGPKTGFFEYTEKFCQLFLLNLFYNETFYYLLCFCKNPIFGKILVPEIYIGQNVLSQSDCRIF